MRIERGSYGPLPYAAVGEGPPVVLFAGLMPVAGVAGDQTVHAALSGYGALARHRRVIVFNRRRELATGTSMRELAAEHAAAVSAVQHAPIDVIGTSTGGSIAQQLAADYPGLVNRLVLVSTACRLDPRLRATQARIGRYLRDGRRDLAAGAAVDAMLPGWCARPVVRAAVSAASGRIIPTQQDAADLATTIEAEDGFDLRTCPAITAPTLLVAGGRDRLYARELFLETARLIPGCEVCVVRGRGHAGVMIGRRGPGAVRSFLRPDAARVAS